MIYLATLKEAVYVLHCFSKKSAKTLREDVEIARKRYKDLMEQMK